MHKGFQYFKELILYLIAGVFTASTTIISYRDCFSRFQLLFFKPFFLPAFKYNNAIRFGFHN